MKNVYAIMLGFLCLIPRLSGDFSLDQYLWAEDGTVFINQASLGIRAWLEPYAGYLHLYPRIIAWIASGFSLDWAPFILFAGWLLAFIIMVIVVMNRSLKTGIGFLGGLILVALITLQPHSGEVFFNITNAQWIIGIALSLFILIEGHEKISYLKMTALAIACLTGPFCFLLLPALFLKALIFKDFKKNAIVYSIVLICALVQILVLLNVGRPSMALSPGFDTHFFNWIIAGGIFLSFGGGEWIASIIILSLIFWGVAVYVLIRSFHSADAIMVQDRQTSLLLVFAGGLIFLAGLFVVRHDPTILNPLSGAPRFYIIPYALIFFAIALVARHFMYARILLLVSISLICLLQMATLNPSPLYFHAFVEFARHKENLMIPINPNGASYPGWHIMGDVTKPAKVHIDPITIYEMPLSSVDTQWCYDSKYIGLEINLVQNNAGWVQAFWSGEKNFPEQNTLKRYYPTGVVNAHFAFPNTQGPLFFRLDGPAQINWINIYCLGTRT